MYRRILLPAFLLTATSLAAAQNPTATVTGFRINKPLPKELQQFNPGQATSVSVVLSVPNKDVVEVDHRASKLTSFTDDKNTDLARIPPEGFARGWIDSSPGVVDGSGNRVGRVHLHSASLPAGGATKLNIKATIVLQCATGETAIEVKGFEVKVGNEKAVGTMTLGVRKAVNDYLEVTLTSETPIYKDIALTIAGKKLSHIALALERPFVGNKQVYRRAFLLLDGKPEKIDIKVTTYEKLQTVTVPLNLSFGLGS